jgi:uncharacterized membrane protein YeaQ/YmgE (transglycosylase-associated protein family)
MIMNSKPFVWIGMFVGSLIGGYIPALWGDTNLFSFASLILGTIGAVAGIYLGWKMSRY